MDENYKDDINQYAQKQVRLKYPFCKRANTGGKAVKEK